jgi:hypothetical protein
MERKARLSGKLLCALGLLTSAFAAVNATPALASCNETGTSTVTVTCTGTGTWTPPAGLTTASFTLDGAVGGGGPLGGFGGGGGRTTADTVTVSSGTSYQIAAGTRGQNGSGTPGTGGSPGGGAGSCVAVAAVAAGRQVGPTPAAVAPAATRTARAAAEPI